MNSGLKPITLRVLKNFSFCSVSSALGSSLGRFCLNLGGLSVFSGCWKRLASNLGLAMCWFLKLGLLEWVAGWWGLLSICGLCLCMIFFLKVFCVGGEVRWCVALCACSCLA